MRFVDTNILLYAISTAPKERGKAKTARAILESEDLALSVQVLQEFYVQATRTSKRDRITHSDAVGLIEAFLRFPVVEVNLHIFRAALESSRRFQLSYWDATIVEAARALGCSTILSEDLSHGQNFEGIAVHNPFNRGT